MKSMNSPNGRKSLSSIHLRKDLCQIYTKTSKIRIKNISNHYVGDRDVLINLIVLEEERGSKKLRYGLHKVKSLGMGLKSGSKDREEKESAPCRLSFFPAIRFHHDLHFTPDV